jgi:hypothetical protein
MARINKTMYLPPVFQILKTVSFKEALWFKFPFYETLKLARCGTNSVSTYSILLTRFLIKVKRKGILLAEGAGEVI